MKLSRVEGEILMLLMSRPGRYFMSKEIVSEIYWWCPNGGSLGASDSLAVQVCRIRKKFRRAGIDLLVKNPASQHGYMFGGMKLIELPAHPVRERPQLAAAGKSRDRSRASVSRKCVIRPVNSPPKPWRQRRDRRFSESTGIGLEATHQSEL